VGLDFDAAVVESLSLGLPVVFEPGLEDLLRNGLASGALRFSASAEDATRDIEVLWVAYDTPIDDADRGDVELVMTHIERALACLRSDTVVLVSSQLPVGSIRRLEALAATRFPAHTLSFVCCPENLRLGGALDAFLIPDRIVVGAREGPTRAVIARLLETVSARIEWMSIESAEMTKHALNAFLATSAAFANEVATICELVGANAKEVERGLKTDRRIGPGAYLAPGAAFAGGTLGRDVQFLNRIAADARLTTPLLTSVTPSNDAHKGWVRRKLGQLFPQLANTVVAIWGLTYKPGTDTLRRSGAVELCDWLLGQQATIRVHDPAVRELPGRWDGKVSRCTDPLDAVEDADALVIATEWPMYREIAAARLRQRSSSLTVLDAGRFAAGYEGQRGVRYVSVGMPEGGV
jgi:UDPglucose 6-dehydrogenase